MNAGPIAPRKDDRSISSSGSGKRSTRNTSDGEGWSTASSRSRQQFSVQSDKLKNKPVSVDTFRRHFRILTPRLELKIGLFI